jgi:hypothetical protein
LKPHVVDPDRTKATSFPSGESAKQKSPKKLPGKNMSASLYPVASENRTT